MEKEYFDDEKAKAARKARRAEIRAEVGDMMDNDFSSEEESDDEETNTTPETSSNNASSTPGATLLSEALAIWAGSLSRTVQSGKRRKRELDPGLDVLINAETREGIMCRRRVFDIRFDNAAAGRKFSQAKSP